MKVVVKHPAREPEVVDVEPGLMPMKAIIAFGRHDMLEVVADSPPGLDLWANEEGKYAARMVEVQTEDGPVQQVEYAEPNLSLWGGRDYVMGTVFVAGSTSDGETRGLEPAEVAIAVEWLSQRAVGRTGYLRALALAEQFR